jgi:large subunit ribosomal protein L5
MAETAYTPRLRAEYDKSIRGKLAEQFGYANVMQVPRLDKVVLNMGVGEAVNDRKKAELAAADLALIAGQKSRSRPSSCVKTSRSAARSRCARPRCMSSSTA